MSEPAPHIGRCGFCEQGLVRLYRCDECAAVAAVCDECERIWERPGDVHADPNAPADGAHPNCPACPNGDVTWTRLDSEAIADADLSALVVNG